MIKGLGIATIWTTDQERSKRFFTEKVGLEIRDDLDMGDMRWITVGAKDQQDVHLALMTPGGMGMDEESAEALTKLITKGALGAAFTTDDCRADYERLKAAGVEFLQEPRERPYGTEAIFRDDSGNWYSLTQVNDSDELDLSKPWHE